MFDKLILSNKGALEGKYGPAGIAAIERSVDGIIVSDKARGVATKLIYLDDSTHMAVVGGSSVNVAMHEKQNKTAVDAIYAYYQPDYLVLLGASDVIPHIQLHNPLKASDLDPDVPSDLPYACEAYHSRKLTSFLAVTRVVSRIADVTGSHDISPLIGQLEHIARHTTRPRVDYEIPFTITAQVWRASTEESVNNVFGKGSNVHDCPPSGHPQIDRNLAARCHFINCHGDTVHEFFYGEDKAKNMPIAMAAATINGKITRDTIAAVECCYGAELYDPSWGTGQISIANTYIENGAIAFLGSTNIAYGPVSGNGAADLITQYFLIDVLAGASLGRACLQARQKFIKDQDMRDPINLKTLGQFILLGDSSLHACQSPDPIETEAVIAYFDGGEEKSGRQLRRLKLKMNGHAAAEGTPTIGQPIAENHQDDISKLRVIAENLGVNASTIIGYQVSAGRTYRHYMKARDTNERVFVVSETLFARKMARAEKLETLRPKFSRINAIVVHMIDSRIVGVKKYTAR